MGWGSNDAAAMSCSSNPHRCLLLYPLSMGHPVSLEMQDVHVLGWIRGDAPPSNNEQIFLLFIPDRLGNCQASSSEWGWQRGKLTECFSIVEAPFDLVPDATVCLSRSSSKYQSYRGARTISLPGVMYPSSVVPARTIISQTKQEFQNVGLVCLPGPNHRSNFSEAVIRGIIGITSGMTQGNSMSAHDRCPICM